MLYLGKIQKAISALSDALGAAELTNQQIEKQEIAPGFEAETTAAGGLLLARASEITAEICDKLSEINPLFITLVELEAALKILGIEDAGNLEVN